MSHHSSRIALFGGSFNPPHLCHVLAACYARIVSEVDEVWVLPSFHHPYGKELPDFETRFDWCKKAFRALDFVRIRDEERYNPKGYTYDLVMRLRRDYPGYRWSLIGGTDVSDDIVNWYQGEHLREIIEVIEIPRGNDFPASLSSLSSSEVRNRMDDTDFLMKALPPRVLGEFI